MKKHLEKIKKQPDHHKKNIVTVLAVIGTIGLFMAYLFINSLLSSPNEEESKINGFTEIRQVFDQTFKEVEEVRGNYAQEKEVIAELKAEAERQATEEQETETTLEQEQSDSSEQEELPEDQI